MHDEACSLVQLIKGYDLRPDQVPPAALKASKLAFIDALLALELA